MAVERLSQTECRFPLVRLFTPQSYRGQRLSNHFKFIGVRNKVAVLIAHWPPFPYLPYKILVGSFKARDLLEDLDGEGKYFSLNNKLWGAGVVQSVLCLTTDWTTGFDPRQRQRIFPLASSSRPTLEPTQPPVQWVPGVLSPGVKRGRGVTLTTHPHLVPRLRMSRSNTSSHPKRLHGV
jgi:hypothetical protein